MKTGIAFFLTFFGAFYCLHAQQGLTASDLNGFRLRNIGPAFMSGRIADIAKDPADPSTWYVATASGGVWKTENNATTWTPVFDRYGSYSTGAIALDPSDPNVIWLGTGENASQRSAAFGDGVYKSLDGGKSWKNVGLSRSEHIGKILIHPRDPQVVFVAAQGPLWAAGGDRGLYRTLDGGQTWEQVLKISENTGVTDIAFHPDRPDVIYAASYQRRRHVGILVAGGPESAIYKSTDGGTTWKKVTRGLPGGDVGRIALAVSPQRPDVVYASIAAEGSRSGFFRSDDSGETWTRMSDYIVVDPQYYGEIYADPHRFDRVYVMDVVIHVTDDGGRNFRRLNTRNKHVDNHALLFDPNDPDYLMVGCDGGIYESWDQGDSWKFVANLPLTQFYRVGIDNALPFYNVYGGTQDNSTLGGPSRTHTIHGIQNSDWFVTQGGDGFQTRVDPDDPNILYSMSQYAGIVRYDKRSGERVGIQPQAQPGEDALRWHWDAPLIISPHDGQRLYFAAQGLFRSDDRGDSWTPVSGDLSRNIDRNQQEVMGRIWPPEAVWKNVFTSPFGAIVALDESPLREGLLAVGTDDGLIQITENGGTTWRRIAAFPGVPEMTYVSDVRFSRHDAATIYATFNNHKNGDFKPYVLKTEDLGRTWTALHGTLPDREVAWSIIDDPGKRGLLFLGTEFGLFVSLNDGADWTPLKGGLPVVPIRDLEIQERETDLVAASFGRGMFILDHYAPLRELQASGMPETAYLFAVRDAWQYVPANPLGGLKGSLGDALFTAPNPDYGAVFTYYLPESLQTNSARRKAQEREALAAGKPIVYPDWETLRAEDREEQPQVILTVKDAAGNIVRRLTGPASRGIHQVSWDLRMANAAGGRGGGPNALPGQYSVELATYTDGVMTAHGSSRSFEVRPLGLATLPAADAPAAMQFYREAGALAQKVSQADQAIGDALQGIQSLKRSLLGYAEAEVWLRELRATELGLLDFQLILEGDRTREDRAEFVQPGLNQRIRNALSTQTTSSGPTQTHRDDYAIANQLYQDLEARLRAMVRDQWEPLALRLQEAGIAVPGALQVLSTQF